MVTAQHEKIFYFFPFKRKKSPILITEEPQRNSVPLQNRELIRMNNPKIGDISNKGVILCS